MDILNSFEWICRVIAILSYILGITSAYLWIKK